jgi:arsenite methyltransferase
VLKGELPGELQRDAELYVGCVSGAIQKEDYLQIVKDSGFTNIRIQKEREITLPDSVLQNYLSADEITDYRLQDRGIYSVTVFAQKPVADAETKTPSACCGPDCCN